MHQMYALRTGVWQDSDDGRLGYHQYRKTNQCKYCGYAGYSGDGLCIVRTVYHPLPDRRFAWEKRYRKSDGCHYGSGADCHCANCTSRSCSLGRRLWFVCRRSNGWKDGFCSASDWFWLCFWYRFYCGSNHYGRRAWIIRAPFTEKRGKNADVYVVLSGMGAFYEVTIPGVCRPSIYRKIATADVWCGGKNVLCRYSGRDAG